MDGEIPPSDREKPETPSEGRSIPLLLNWFWKPTSPLFWTHRALMVKPLFFSFKGMGANAPITPRNRLEGLGPPGSLCSPCPGYPGRTRSAWQGQGHKRER